MTQVTSLSTFLSDLKSQREQLLSECVQSKEECKEKQNVIDKQTCQINELEEMLGDSNTFNDRLKETVKLKQEEVGRLNRQVKELEEELDLVKRNAKGERFRWERDREEYREEIEQRDKRHRREIENKDTEIAN